MKDKETRRDDLLAKLIGTIAESICGMEDDEYDYGHGWIPELRYVPYFEFDEEDIEIIKELAELYPECEEFLEWIEKGE